jgi:hypothetical protein
VGSKDKPVGPSLEDLIQLGKRFEQEPGFLMELAQDWLKVRSRDGPMMDLKANAVQRTFEAQRGRENVVLKARQMGMTTWIAARFFLRTVTRPGTMTLQVAHTREAAEGIFAMVRRMWTHLPDEWRKGPLRLARSNVRQLVFAEIDSEFRVASAAEDNAGRGLSVQNLHCSEVARWPGDVAATLAGLRAALAPHGECVIESTPNGAYGAFYEEWLRAVEPGTGEGPVRHFFPWWLEEKYVGPAAKRETWTETEQALGSLHGLTEAQMGFRRSLTRSYGALHAQEFAESADTCFRATGACCFELEAIEERMQTCDPPLERRRNGALQLWLPAQSGCKYVVAVDTASGSAEGDFAAVQVVEIATGLQCAELQQRLRPAELAHAVAELAREFSGAIVAVERNNHGSAVLAYLETRERYTRLWRDSSGEAGWLTTAASKPEMIARLGVLIAETPSLLKSRRLLAECRTFVSSERGRMGAAGGAHDDLVMAMALAHSVRGELLLAQRSLETRRAA